MWHILIETCNQHFKLFFIKPTRNKERVFYLLCPFQEINTKNHEEWNFLHILNSPRFRFLLSHFYYIFNWHLIVPQSMPHTLSSDDSTDLWPARDMRAKWWPTWHCYVYTRNGLGEFESGGWFVWVARRMDTKKVTPFSLTFSTHSLDHPSSSRPPRPLVHKKCPKVSNYSNIVIIGPRRWIDTEHTEIAWKRWWGSETEWARASH